MRGAPTIADDSERTAPLYWESASRPGYWAWKTDIVLDLILLTGHSLKHAHRGLPDRDGFAGPVSTVAHDPKNSAGEEYNHGC